MEPRDAQSLIRMVEANWHCDLGKEGRELWRQMLEPYDAGVATRAVALLAKHPLPGGRARPNVADLRTIIVSISRHDSEENWRELPAGPLPRPAWVDRWERARAEGDQRAFPEQIPGYLALQKEDPANATAYALPDSPTTNEADWVQPHEYVGAA